MRFKMQNLDFVNPKCVTYVQPIPVPLKQIKWNKNAFNKHDKQQVM